MTADAVGGVWTYALELVDALAASDVEVHLAVMGPSPSDAQRAEAEASSIAGLHENPGPLEWMPDPWDELADSGEWLLRLEELLRPDLIHLNSYVHGALPWRAPVVVVGHSCVLSWWEAVRGEPAPPAWNRYRDEVARGLASADAVVAPSSWMLDELGRLYAVRGGRVVLNGLRPRPDAASRKEPVVLTAGRLWDEAKNVAAVLSVAPELSGHVEIAGTESGAARDNVRCLGRLPRARLLERLRRAAVFALPVRYEPFGLGPLEAAAARCALVLGDTPSMRELWGDAAHLVHPDDHAGLRDTCNGLLLSDDRRALWAERARRRAAELTAERMAARYLSLYQVLTVREHAGSREAS